MAAALRGRGYSVLEAADGVEALRIAADHGGPIHLLVADAVMPALSGRELCRLVRLQRPATGVLIVSGYASADAPADFAFLSKPFRLADLVRTVEGILDRPPD
jgi:two-component system cell cycle sensor histidine kinase/response regulator CckA